MKKKDIDSLDDLQEKYDVAVNKYEKIIKAYSIPEDFALGMEETISERGVK